jgi:glycosyltransferase involved in cell wall biosynthesis
MTDALRCSVVVPCYNRSSYLDRLLRSLTWSVVPPSEFEVVVVNDGGGDDVQLVAEAWRRRGLDVRCFDLRPPGPPRNNAKARNAGWRAARHPLIIHTDPEIVFTTDVLLHYRRAIGPGRFCSCGGFYQLTRDSTQELMAAEEHGPLAPAAYLAHAAGRPNQVVSPDGVGALHGAFGIRRDDLETAGGYDESFGEWGWEDRELLVTLRHDLGLERDRLSDVVLVHPWHPPLRGCDRRAELAAVGGVSDAAWRVQFQRARAEWPRSQRRFRDVDLADSEPSTGRLSPERYRQVIVEADRLEFARARAVFESGDERGAGKMLPTVYQQLCRAMELEAAALRGAGLTSLAVAVGLETLSCPWEGGDGEQAARLEYHHLLGAPVSPTARLYAAVPGLLGELAVTLGDAGQADRAERVLATLSEWQGDSFESDVVRLRQALRIGDPDAAVLIGRRLSADGRAAGVLPLLIETAMIDGSWSSARNWCRGLRDDAAGNHFARLGAHACLEAMSARPSERADGVFEGERADAVSSDASEHLFSAAMRSARTGLDLTAVLLLERFLGARPPAESRLFVEAERQLTILRGRQAWQRWTRGARPTRA